MSEYITKVEAEFQKWKSSPPNIVQRGTGYITKPVEFLLRPFIDKIAPLLENSIMSINDYLSQAIIRLSKKDSEIFIDVETGESIPPMNIIFKANAFRLIGQTARSFQEKFPDKTGVLRKRLRKVIDDLIRVGFKLVYHSRKWSLKLWSHDPWLPIFSKLHETFCSL